jgi:hypothetical protein
MVWASSQYAAEFNGSQPFEPSGYITDYYTDEAVNVINNNVDRPFFIYLGHFAPHNPLQSLKRDYEKHQHMQNHTLQVYSGMIEALDRSIGKIVKALEENGLSENTLIILPQIMVEQDILVYMILISHIEVGNLRILKEECMYRFLQNGLKNY